MSSRTKWEHYDSAEHHSIGTDTYVPNKRLDQAHANTCSESAYLQKIQ